MVSSECCSFQVTVHVEHESKHQIDLTLYDKCRPSEEKGSNTDGCSKLMHKLALLVEIPLYRVDTLNFWKHHAVSNSIDLSKVDLTVHTLHPTPQTTSQCEPALNTKIDEQSRCGCLPTVPCSQHSQIIVKTEPEDYVSLYEGHTIKEEMVIGPTVVENRSNRHDTSKKEQNDCKRKRKIKSVHQNSTKDTHSCGLYECSECDKKFKRIDYLRNHNIRRHGHFGKTYTCECGKQYNDRSQFNRHTKGYCTLLQNTKKFECDICQKNYPNKIKLAHHMYRHKPKTAKSFKYICDFCNKAYPERRDLVRHMTRHMKIAASYPCKICPKEYYSGHGLRRHMKKIHSEKYQYYSCRKCTRIFRIKRYYLEHLSKCSQNVQGVGEQLLHKVYDKSEIKCEMCSRKFKLVQAFIFHWNLIHVKRQHSKKKEVHKKIQNKRPLNCFDDDVANEDDLVIPPPSKWAEIVGVSEPQDSTTLCED